jgi:Tfp pilus assembly protein PilO
MNKMLRQIAFFAVLMAVPLGAWAFVFRPRNAEIAMARADVDLRLIQLEELREVETINEDLEQTLEQLNSALMDLRARIPDAAGIEDILRRIAEITQENQLVVRSFKREKTVESAHYVEMPLKTVIEGSFEGIHRFLVDLERMPRITRILDMKIENPNIGKMTRGNDQIAEGDVRAEMTITIYADLEKETQG